MWCNVNNSGAPPELPVQLEPMSKFVWMWFQNRDLSLYNITFETQIAAIHVDFGECGDIKLRAWNSCYRLSANNCTVLNSGSFPESEF